MAVPTSKANYLKNTVGGAFSGAREGGTVLGNTTATSVITKTLPLKDNATVFKDGTLPKAKNNGLVANQKALSSGTFAYDAVGNYVIATISSTLSGVANNSLLITSRGDGTRSIAQFEHDFGAKLLTMWRTNRFSWLGVKADGTKLGSRRNWTNAISGGGDASAAPPTLSAQNMLNPETGSTAYHSDSAANPTRAIPGELVMKVDFVTTSVASGGDFFDYKAITGV